MGVTKDEHRVQIGEHDVAVTGTSGAIHATWTLSVDGEAVDSAAAAGDFTLRGDLPDSSRLEARIHQSLVGPTTVVVVHAGNEVASFRGFVA